MSDDAMDKAREIVALAVELADNAPTAGACGGFKELVRQHGALLIAAALREARAEALEEAARLDAECISGRYFVCPAKLRARAAQIRGAAPTTGEG